MAEIRLRRADFWNEILLTRVRRNISKLLVPRVTDATTKEDLREFANRVLEAWFRLPSSERPKIISCRILSITDSMGVKQRHGCLDVTPDDAAVKIIRKLKGAFLRGKRVGVKSHDDSSVRAIIRP